MLEWATSRVGGLAALLWGSIIAIRQLGGVLRSFRLEERGVIMLWDVIAGVNFSTVMCNDLSIGIGLVSVVGRAERRGRYRAC